MQYNNYLIKMYAEPHQKQQPDQQQFMIEQQINLFSLSLPEINRGDSDIFFKEIYHEEGYSIASVQLGFHVANISPQLYDFTCVLVNQIHCFSEQNLKIIIDGNQIWATSTIIYPLNSIGDSSYNIMQSNNRQSLMKTAQILKQILKQCKERYERNEADGQILKAAQKKFKLIQIAFKNPNADY